MSITINVHRKWRQSVFLGKQKNSFAFVL